MYLAGWGLKFARSFCLDAEGVYIGVHHVADGIEHQAMPLDRALAFKGVGHDVQEVMTAAAGCTRVARMFRGFVDDLEFLRCQCCLQSGSEFCETGVACHGSTRRNGVTGTLAVANFRFDTVSAASYEVPANGYFSGIDDINITPEPASLMLLGLGGLALLRRRR